MPVMKNYMETCVQDSLKPVLESINACTCDICKYDITAIALNTLPPKYVVTRKGQIYTKLTVLHNQFDVDIITAITRAAGIVAASPRHELEETETI